MNRIVQIRLALFAIGILVWGYGVAVGDRTIRWVGIAVLLVSLLLRFIPPGRRDGGQPSA